MPELSERDSGGAGQNERGDGDRGRAKKLAAEQTLYNVLVTLTKLVAPVVPFLAESMYQNLVVNAGAEGAPSVHLCDYPKADEALLDERLSADVEALLRLTQLGSAARKIERSMQQCTDFLDLVDRLRIARSEPFAGVAAGRLSVLGPTRDYYRLQAFFANTSFGDGPLPLKDPAERKKYEEQYALWDSKTKAIRDEMLQSQREFLEGFR